MRKKRNQKNKKTVLKTGGKKIFYEEICRDGKKKKQTKLRIGQYSHRKV